MSSILAIRPTQSRVRSLTVETIRDFDSFLRLKPDWDALVAAAAIEHPFGTHDWICVWWECFSANRTLHIVVVREGADVVGIAPMLEETELSYGFRVRKLTFIWNTDVPRCDFIVKGRRPDIYSAIWDQFMAESARWDLLLLPQLAEGSPTLTRFTDLASSSGFLVGMWTSESSPYIPISGTWADYRDSLPRKHRSKMESRNARLSRRGTIEREELANDSLDLENGLPLETGTWYDSNGAALLSDIRVRSFYSTLCRTPGIRDSVRLHYLLSGGTRIAFTLSLYYADAVYLIEGGYLPEYSAYSPFHILASMNIEECFRNGIQRYDFLGKEEDWKSRWSRSALSHHWMCVYPNNPQTALSHAMKFRLVPTFSASNQPDEMSAAV